MMSFKNKRLKFEEYLMKTDKNLNIIKFAVRKKLLKPRHIN